MPINNLKVLIQQMCYKKVRKMCYILMLRQFVLETFMPVKPFELKVQLMTAKIEGAITKPKNKKYNWFLIFLKGGHVIYRAKTHAF